MTKSDEPTNKPKADIPHRMFVGGAITTVASALAGLGGAMMEANAMKPLHSLDSDAAAVVPQDEIASHVRRVESTARLGEAGLTGMAAGTAGMFAGAVIGQRKCLSLRKKIVEGEKDDGREKQR